MAPGLLLILWRFFKLVTRERLLARTVCRVQQQTDKMPNLAQIRAQLPNHFCTIAETLQREKRADQLEALGSLETWEFGTGLLTRLRSQLSFLMKCVS